VTKPLEIYLNYCQRLARQNLKHIKIKVDPYRFSRLDFDHNRVDPKILQRIEQGVREENMKSGKQQFAQPFEEEDIGNNFTSVGIKIFTEIVFIDNIQILVVKTWQRVRYSTWTQKEREVQ
jgi:hypothetical protein